MASTTIKVRNNTSILTVRNSEFRFQNLHGSLKMGEKKRTTNTSLGAASEFPYSDGYVVLHPDLIFPLNCLNQYNCWQNVFNLFKDLSNIQIG